jgi:manganese transport protein
VTLMTCTAEVGGVAIVLQLLSGWEYRLLILLGALGLVLAAWFLRFEWIERLFGYMGLCLLVFAVAAIDLGVDWGEAAQGLVPNVGSSDHLVYAYFVVGLLGAALTPYEVYFYSSGAVEDRWSPRDLGTNRLTAIVGYALGGLLSVALMAVAAAVFLPAAVEPSLLGTPALPAAIAFGQLGLLLALLGMLFAIGGAAIETCFAGAYNIAQQFGWEWGKSRRPRHAPRFTLAWLAMLVLATLVVLTGVDPVLVTEYSVVFSVVALPLTYVPILLVANDPVYMNGHENGRAANALACFYLVVILVVAVSAIPLMLLTNMGQG